MKPNPIIVLSVISDAARTQTGIGVILDCALQNAGFDGRHLHDLDKSESAEVVRHIDSIVDARMVGDDATEGQYQRVARILQDTE